MHRVADPVLSARLSRVAAASGYSSLKTLPSAAVLLLPLHLPLKSEKKRQKALPFMMEPYLAETLDAVHLALGPCLGEDRYLCAAVGREHVVAADLVVPDILAVPIPERPTAWTLWCAEHQTYIRFPDGGGMSVLPEALAPLWQAQRRPEIDLAFGTPPPNVTITQHLGTVPDPDPTVFALNLSNARPTHNALWRGRLTFAGCAAFAAVTAHAAIAHFEARALADLAAQRAQPVMNALAQRGLPGDLGLPTASLVRALGQTGTVPQADPFLTLLSKVSAALTATNVSLRDLRFDGGSNTITALITGNTLAILQSAESALKASGLTVTSGSAARTDAGAELQLIVSDPA